MGIRHKNVVPRSPERDCPQGQIGTLAKKWLWGIFQNLHIAGHITDGTNIISVAGVAGAVGTGHNRLHDIDSSSDHNPADAGDYGKYLKANSSTGAPEWVTITAPTLLIVDTYAAITAMTPAAPASAFATDKNRRMLWDGSDWWIEPFVNFEDAGTPDMGIEAENNRLGYGTDYITDKTLNNVRLGSNCDDGEGGLRQISGELQAYLDGAWQAVVTGFRFRENADGSYQLEHRPIGFDTWIIVHSGNSNEVGLNGLPIVQGYSVDMGAYPTQTVISGGTF